MPFDQPTRNRLQRFVSDARRLLSDEFKRQLQQNYGLDPDSGEVTGLDKLGHLDDQRLETARVLREILSHYLSGEPSTHSHNSRCDVLDRIIREQAFTVLNRLAALRMMEARGLLLESVAKGYPSKGFQLYNQLAGPALGGTGDAYRGYLFSLFDEFALDLAVLFDRYSPQGRLFPSETVLEKLLSLLNAADLDALWAEDETIGWIYQYWNSKEERKAMRDASAAPRNSRELAVRNQFFTPRYVVEFLTDNTLGRIWYEMTQGRTGLKDQCRYLVRRPQEVFLGPGEPPPQAPDSDTEPDLSQEQLLQQPVHIPHRPLKDPRDIRLLDPACGSMHFGLYAFDLFETLYQEAWDNDLCPALQQDYPSRDDYLHDVPRLIIEHNIHGVDIDPRAVQIAGLSLWLRAQKSWQAIPAAQRPRIRRSNIVCAEPMPGSDAMLEDFVQTLDPPLLGELVRTVFDKMRLAGEAGMLLKIEEEIRDAIDDAREAWERLGRQSPDLFSSGYRDGVIDQPELSRLDTALRAPGIELSGDFFDTAEDRIYTALKKYAESAESGGYQRRLFAEDTSHGFAFIDLCRKRYDAVVMNPPFGASSRGSREHNQREFPVSKTDVGIAFADRGVQLTGGAGLVGAITSRVVVGNHGLADWRLQLVAGAHQFRTFLDVGYGVLDDAMVEAAVYTIGATVSPQECFFLRVLDETAKEAAIDSFFVYRKNAKRTFSFWRRLSLFVDVPGRVLCYWLPEKFLNSLSESRSLKDVGGDARHGLQTTDDYRFLRLAWEAHPTMIGRHRSWVFFAKGGEYLPLWDDLHLLILWNNDGKELKQYVSDKAELTQGSGGWSRWINAWDDYFRAGLTFPERTTSDFSPRALPGGCIFSATGEAIFFEPIEQGLHYLAGSYTRPFKVVVDGFVGSGDSSVPGSAANHYRSGLINSLPAPVERLGSVPDSQIIDCIKTAREFFAYDESSRFYIGFPTCQTIVEVARIASKEKLDGALDLLRLSRTAEADVFDYLGFDSADRALLDSIIGIHPMAYPETQDSAHIKDLSEEWKMSESDLISLATERHGARRQLTKKSFFGDRKLEVLSHLHQLNPAKIVNELNTTGVLGVGILDDIVEVFISHQVGSALGRWDIRYATGERQPPELPDPFDPLPVCPPGMLQNADGLPAAPDEVPDDYPLRISWPGILVDDAGHPEDIVARVRDALTVIWGERASSIEQEACDILGIKRLRDYFAEKKAGGKFFKDHLKRYSKSRRKAPIYWPLSTPSGSYTLWLYYHRLDDQILYACVNEFVAPKLEQVSDSFDTLRQTSARNAKQEKEFAALTDLKLELEEFSDQLLSIARTWRPNLNDGVQITAAPLWSLFRLKPWQKVLKDSWTKLEKGDYDWAHLAFSYWPDRVREKCRSDKSLAIAHDLEDLYEPLPEQPKKKRRKGKNA